MWPPVFKTGEGRDPALAGSIPVRLRVERTESDRSVLVTPLRSTSRVLNRRARRAWSGLDQAEAAAVDALDDPQGQSPQVKWVPLRGLMLLCLIEPEPRLGELALGEGKDLGGPDFEDVGDACVVIEGAVAHVEPPVALVLV